MNTVNKPIVIYTKWNVELPNNEWMHSANTRSFTNSEQAEKYIAQKLRLLDCTKAYFEIYNDNVLLFSHYQKNSSCLKY